MMRRFFYLLTSLLFATGSYGQSGVWTLVEQDPNHGGTASFLLEESSLEALLFRTGAEANSGVRIEIPNREGKLQSFIVWENDLLPVLLKSKFPEVRTYSGVLADNPHVSLKLEKTTLGWYAMVFQENSTYYIYRNRGTDAALYSVAGKMAFPKSGPFQCETEAKAVWEAGIVDGTPVRIPDGDSEPLRITTTANGNLIRKYRLALACTGEYAEAVAGPNPTVPDVLSAMVVTLNRVNGIYERELGIRFQLVDHNDTLLFLDHSSDPYSNFSAGAMLSQNQNTLADRIGSSNYDIGHVFSTGGGGLAILGATCHFSAKAKGVTGMANPVGDPFAVDYVAHEIGHQMGANHTFNSCGGNTNMNTAFEPGSGSTIMGYAGICGANNIQEHSDAYFHSASLTEIVTFIETEGTCAIEGPGGPAVPEDSVLDLHFIIPAETPFELEGPGGGLNGADSLLYCWEQWDLGNLNAPESGSADYLDGPTFRSFSPATSQWRIFPGLENILANNTSVSGERLPRFSRTLQFQYTIRHVVNGLGAFRTMDDLATVEVVETGAPFELTAPEGAGLGFASGASIDLSWNVAGTNQSPINCDRVDIYFSDDGGHTFAYLLATNVPNTGVTTVELPAVITEEGRIKIKSSGNIFFDINNQNFAVGEVGVEAVKTDQLFRLFPNPASTEIQLLHSFGRGAVVNITDLSGKTIWTGAAEDQMTIHTANWARGIYLVQIKQQDSTSTRKLILQ